MLNQTLSILYLGPISGTCLDRANALRRLGHSVEHLDLRGLLPKSVWIDRITWHVGGNAIAPFLLKTLTQKLRGKRFNLCYVDGGELVTPSVISALKNCAEKVINYNIDDPLGERDGRRYAAYRESLNCYDLLVVMRKKNQEELEKLGAKNILRVFMSADEITHAPRNLTDTDFQLWASEVLFLGAWFPERGPFLLELTLLGVPLTIRGPNWHKAPEWTLLKKYWKGPGVSGDDYAKAIQCAKVNLGLLSKGNRDLHTTRSLEVPALGGLLCAERTTEHLAMYQEGQEALFWESPEECAIKCQLALVEENYRSAIASAGNQRVHKNKHFNESVLNQILIHAGFS